LAEIENDEFAQAKRAGQASGAPSAAAARPTEAATPPAEATGVTGSTSA
jgi:hypothetical protein